MAWALAIGVVSFATGFCLGRWQWWGAELQRTNAMIAEHERVMRDLKALQADTEAVYQAKAILN